MSKFHLITSTEDIRKLLVYDIFQKELKNKKGFLFTFEEDKVNVNKNYKKYIFKDKKNLLEILDFVKKHEVKFLIINYLKFFDVKGINKLFSFSRENDIDLYLISNFRKTNFQEPKVWHIRDSWLANGIDEMIFLYTKDNEIKKRVLNKEQIIKEKNQTPTLDRGLWEKAVKEFLDSCEI